MDYNKNTLIIRNKESSRIYDIAKFVGKNNASVLIEGESGTGKSRLAKYIHENGLSAKKPFIVINCNSIPEELFASELFGYLPNAFTDASPTGKIGLLEAAHEGTVLLDEINELSLANQAVLLHFLQNKTITPIGGVNEKEIQTRIICTTGSPLYEMVQAGTFRLDLYYRIRVIGLKLSPIRERRDEIIPFIHHFLHLHGPELGVNPESFQFTEEEIKCLESLDWPGNIRELENFAQQLCLTIDKESCIHNAMQSAIKPQKVIVTLPKKPSKATYKTLKEATEEFQARYIQQAIGLAPNLQAAADQLGISLSSLMRKKRELLP